MRDFYSSKGVPVIDLSHDQDSTDLAKCLSYIERNHEQDSTRDGIGTTVEETSTSGEILVLGAMGGRLDHTLSNLNALYMFR